MKKYLIVTTINQPNRILKILSEQAQQEGYIFIIVGDAKSPKTFELSGSRYYEIDAQNRTNFEFANACPTGTYSRKNIGYLIAIRENAKYILETDDDNIPQKGFFDIREKVRCVPTIDNYGWFNVYKIFSDRVIWPRGFPLNSLRKDVPLIDAIQTIEIQSPIQQGLADNIPDTDAIYRLLYNEPVFFFNNINIALGNNTWTPFNSQNTAWWEEAFPLLYLPVHCPFRMTDIWRSFVAQRIAWANDWRILHSSPTVRQERNPHDLMADFSDEIAGYKNNHLIVEKLKRLNVHPGIENIPENMKICYREFISMGLIDEKEMDLLNKWFKDLANMGVGNE